MINYTQAHHTLSQRILKLRLFYACAFLLFTAAPSWALPFTFAFTGTINVPIVSNGALVNPYYITHPEWTGSLVRGNVTLNLDEVMPSEFNNAGFSQYSATSVNPNASWMAFNVQQPDGSVLNIPGSAAPMPIPEAEGNDAYTYLAHLYDVVPDSGFYAQRTLSNSVTYPQQHMSLTLRAMGEGAASLTSSANYSDVVIQPPFANYENAGYVPYYTAPNEGYEYNFKIDSLTRIVDLPEPSTWMLMLLAIGGLAIARLRRVS